MKKIVIVNQAVNYLTIGYANAFFDKFKDVTLITGSIHVQGEELNENIKLIKIKKWQERPPLKKLTSYIIGTIQIYFLLLIKFRNHEVFFISIPPWGYLLNLFIPNRFSMMIWDVYPDIFKIKGMKDEHLLYKFWSFLNKKSFKKAYKIFTIGEKTAELITQYVNRSKITITWIWSIFELSDKISKEENIFIKEHNLEDKFIVQYSGNIGLTHNVEYMIDIAERLKENKKILFQIIGRGPRLPHIKKLVEEKSLPNCQFLPFQTDEMFPHSLSAADIGVVILDERVAKGSVPSKSYNLMSFGIPSLYIAPKESELNDYAQRFRHAECFNKNELEKAVEFINTLVNDKEKYEYYSKNAVEASKNFRRINADKLVEEFLTANGRQLTANIREN